METLREYIHDLAEGAHQIQSGDDNELRAGAVSYRLRKHGGGLQ